MKSLAKVILDVKDIKVEFRGHGGVHRALDGVSLQLHERETLAVVGESGCGKTTLARSILGLQPIIEGSIYVDEILVKGVQRNLASKVGMVWQDPYASLDPKWTIGQSITEPMRLAGKKNAAEDILKEVGLNPRLTGRYPHQLSGGQRQRVAIGRALALRPPLVICDEPTAALDLSIQAQILNLLKDIQQELGCAFLYISHDLMTVRYLADRVAVMYMGRIVEQGPTDQIFNEPKHPYTKTLLDSAPTLEKIGYLPEATKGELPDSTTLFTGCRFANRCNKTQEICKQEDPKLQNIGKIQTWCHFPYGYSQ